MDPIPQTWSGRIFFFYWGDLNGLGEGGRLEHIHLLKGQNQEKGRGRRCSGGENYGNYSHYILLNPKSLEGLNFLQSKGDEINLGCKKSTSSASRKKEEWG